MNLGEACVSYQEVSSDALVVFWACFGVSVSELLENMVLVVGWVYDRTRYVYNSPYTDSPRLCASLPPDKLLFLDIIIEDDKGEEATEMPLPQKLSQDAMVMQMTVKDINVRPPLL